MPKSPCNGVNATDAAETRVKPGDSRRMRLASYIDGVPYGIVATFLPKVVCHTCFSRIAGSPSEDASAFIEAPRPTAPPRAAINPLRIKPRRVSSIPFLFKSAMASWVKKFSGAC